MAIDVIVVTSDPEGSTTMDPIRYEGAFGLQSPDSGALVLLDSRKMPVAAYAPGTWFMAEVAGSGKHQD